MTYSVGGVIQAADYNTFQTNLNTIWSTGSTDSGWGQPALTSVSNSGTTGVIASVTIANTAGVLTVTAGSYFIGQQIQISGTLTAGTINGTNNYTTPSIFYIITVASSTSITISLTPSGAAVASTAGTATPGGTFNVLSAQSLVTASQWASLVNNLSAAGSQTSTTLTARTAPVAGAAISVLPNLATDITNVTARRGYATSSGTTSSTWFGNVSELNGTNPGNDFWTHVWFFTINLAPDGLGGVAAKNSTRYFWNAGGLIRLDMKKTSTGTAMDAVWNTFVDTVGTLYLSGRVNNANQVIAGVTYTGFTRIGGSGTPSTNLTTTGWWQLPNTGITPATVELFKLYNTVVPYTDSYIQVSARLFSAGGGQPADTRSPEMQIIVTWYQPALAGSTQISGGTDTPSPFTAFGTAPTVLCRFIPPSIAQGLSQSWLNPTVVAQV
jgi:hypothetical protein